MTRRIWTNIFITIILMASLASAFTAKAEEPVKLEWKLKAGDVLNYKADMDITVSAGTQQKSETKIEMLITSIVTEVGEDSVMTGGDVIVTKPLQMLVNGKDKTSEMAKQINFLRTWKRRPNGTEFSVLEPTAPFGLPSEQTSWKIVPAKPVKVGDSWTEERTVPSPVKWKLTFTSTLLGFEKVNGYDCAKIKRIGRIEGPTVTTGSSESTIFFAVNGVPVKAEMTMNINIKQPPLGMREKGHTKIELSNWEKLKADELKRTREELALIRATQELKAQGKLDEAKAEFGKFLANHPESRWRKGVEGILAQIDMMKQSQVILPHKKAGIEGLIRKAAPDKKKPIKLEFKLKAGDVLSYTSTWEGQTEVASAPKMETRYEELLTSIVTKVDEDGVMKGGDVAVVKLSQAKMGGMDSTLMQQRMMQENMPGLQNLMSPWKMEPNGNKLPLLKLALCQPFGGGLEQTVVLFKKEPVKMGDSWTQTTGKQVFTSTLLGFEQVKGYNCAKIRTTMKRETPEIVPSYEATIFFAPSEGLIVKVEMTTSMDVKKVKQKSRYEVGIELSNWEKLKADELKRTREELALIRAAQELKAQGKLDEAKAEFEKFLANHPKSRWRKGVEGQIAQIDADKRMKGMQPPKE